MTPASRKVALGWLLLAALPAAPASGQQRRYPIRPFKILKVGGDVTLSADFQDDRERSSDTGYVTYERQRTFEESIGLKAKGYGYHPNLVDWSASLRFALDQDRETTETGRQTRDGRNLDYSFRAAILREKPLSFRISGVGATNTLKRSATGRFELDTRNLAFEALTRGELPSSLLLESIRRDEVDADREERERTKHLAFRIADQRHRDWRTELRYERQDTDETAVTSGAEADQSFVSDELNLRNSWRFGPKERKHALNGGVRVLRRRGFYFHEVFAADQRLRLSHSKTLTTHYQARWDADKTENENDRTLSGEIGFGKRFYESLDVNGRLYFSYRRFVDGTEDIRGGDIDLDYRKKTPLGLFSSSLSLGRETEKEQSSAGRRTARSETIALSGTTFERLSQPSVMSGTVVVMNQTRTTTYTEDLDYRLRTVGAFTEIARTISGSAIADGQTVLVDYVVEVAREAEFVTDNVDWSNSLGLKALPLTLYFRTSLTDRRLVAGESPGNLDKKEVALAGARWRSKRLTVTAEHEITDQRLSPPTTESRLNLRYFRKIGRNTSVSLGGRAAWLRYRKAAEFGLEAGRDFRNNYGASADLTSKLSRSTLLRVTGEYDHTRGQDNESRAGIGVTLQWKFGEIEFSVDSRYDLYTQESISGRESSIIFKVARRF